MFAALHFAITAFSFEFPDGSGPPSFTAINSSLPNFVKIFPLAASAFPFFACMLCHLLCPDMFSLSFNLFKFSLLFYFTTFFLVCVVVFINLCYLKYLIVNFVSLPISGSISGKIFKIIIKNLTQRNSI